MESKVYLRNPSILILFALAICSMIVITGCDDDNDNPILGNTVGAEVSWSLQQVDQAGNVLHDVDFVDITAGWAVGGAGTILRYSNSVWSTQTADVTGSLRGVSFVSTTTGWVAGQNGLILSTSDGGINWKIDSMHLVCFIGGERIADDLNAIQFVDSANGWAVGANGIILKYSVDSACVDSTFLYDSSMTNLFLFDTTFDYFVTVTDSIIDIDSWYDWPDVGLVIDTIFYIQYDTLVKWIDTTLLPFDTVVTETQTGWFKANSKVGPDLWDVCFVDAANGWAVGKLGTIRHSSDGGQTWSNQESGSSLSLRSVCFVDPLNGWVAGHNGLILRTSDGGNSWHRQFNNSGISDHFLAIDFPDAANGWVVGSSGDIYRTADGGNNWYRDRPGFEKGWNGISFIDATTGWTVGFGGNVMNSLATP